MGRVTDTPKLLAAVEEIKVGYKRRYGLAYVEAHTLANAVPELLAEIERLKAENISSKT